MFPAEPRTDDGTQVDDGQGRPGAPAMFRQRTGPSLPASPGEVVVAPDGEIDGCTAPDLLARLLDALHTAAGRTLVVDLRRVEFMGACGITVLLTIRADALAVGVPFAVVADQRAVLRPLTIATLVHELPVHPTVADTRGGPAPTGPFGDHPPGHTA